MLTSGSLPDRQALTAPGEGEAAVREAGEIQEARTPGTPSAATVSCLVPTCLACGPLAHCGSGMWVWR